MIKIKSKALFFVLFFFLMVFFLEAQNTFYWEEPEVFSPSGGSFPASAYNGDFSVLIWQETEKRPAGESGTIGGGSIRIALALKEREGGWKRQGIIGGPYAYSGSEPSILTVAIDLRGRILIAAAASTSRTEILVSEDRGLSFERYHINSGAETLLAPRIAIAADGSYLLFVTRGNEDSLSIYYARSANAQTWTPFEPFVTDPGMQLNFLPSHVSFGSSEYVVFQSYLGGVDTTPSFQLFFKISNDGGRTWTPSRLFTNFRDPYMSTGSPPDNFDNQRPHLSVQGDSLFLVWERRYRNGSPQIYAASVGRNGNLLEACERVNSSESSCSNPIGFSHNGLPLVVWFENRRGQSRIYLARRTGLTWQDTELPAVNAGDASFGRPASDADGLYIFWQASGPQDSSWIYSLLPDTSVTPPRIIAGNFSPGRRSRGERVLFSWDPPADSSGIQGVSYSWSRDEEALPDKRVMIYNNQDARAAAIETAADEEGIWYFSIMARDYAGNWSLPARMEYIRDITPPPAAAIIRLPLDGNGYLVSNSFTMRWNPPPASDIAGYTWSLQYLGPAGMPVPPIPAGGGVIRTPRIQGTENYAVFENQDDGAWSFTVSAIDEVGNIGPASTIIFRTNKYVPHTYITWVDARQDEQGILNFRLIGRGFADGGNVVRVFLDDDGKPPYQREFLFRRGEYRVASDREINNLIAEGLDEGTYRVGVEHPLRGIYFSPSVVSVSETGTVKFGDFSASWEPSWLRRGERRFTLNTPYLILIAVLVFCLLGILVTLRGIGSVVAEGAVLRLDAAALLTGDFMPSEKKKRVTRIRRRGVGLRLKLASFTIALVMLVVVMVSAPMYLMMTQIQRETLFRGLWDRSTVLLEALTGEARAYLAQRNILELGFLPARMSAIPEAQYVTITGYNPEAAVFGDQVWATNDPAITETHEKIDTLQLQPGVSRITDVISPALADFSRELEDQARREVGEISTAIGSLNQEALGLALRSDEASRRRLDEIQASVRNLEARVTERLNTIGGRIASEPSFSLENFELPPDGAYIFYKPIMFRQGSEEVFFRGLIRLGVSVDSILDSIAEGQRNLFRVIILVALAAVIIGAIGALLLSTIIIIPIRRLVSHVEIIRDTEDKSRLEGVEIRIKSRDEIAVLGTTINDMTEGLVKAAAAASDLSIGKEIQKKFIPLELDREGNKLTSGAKDTKNLYFFGYYEGAKGVSGDYFDYQDLDGRYYAVIKCDVAGKGIPAALIMIQVATMFLNYFKQWKPTEKGMRINDVVYQINDFIETLAFKGRFAAFTLCLFDSQTGVVRFCNAGDNIVHLFDASEGRLKTLTLPETPATGVLPNFMIESKGGYTVQSITIDPGDILLLYTDGIEEAKRKFRGPDFEEIICAEGGAPNDTPHENHVVGQGDEEMGPDRVQGIINAVMNREVYTLHKWHNPEGNDRDLTFDFTGCQGSVEEVIMAMVSVEKMFRCYKSPRAAEDNRVLVDKKVDAFLKEHFLQYRTYCSNTRENPGNDAYMYYTFVDEDDQYDDLTILGIKRK
ncbi:MAG: SpoIIE family protein phosphatase [Treponema sp.]|jgi:hypothetical protein|nr:SpoIIE family protein phosphatase [Treponema sp.]